MRLQLPEAFEPLFSPARYKAFYGGRGGGKSHAFAIALVIQAAQRPLRVLCAREIQKSIKDSVKRLIDDRIADCGLSGFYESTETEVRGANGSLFLFAGLRTNADSIKSMEGLDIAWCEESNRISQRSLDLLIPTVRKPGSELWFGWNPDQPTDPVDAMFRGGAPPPNSVVREVHWDHNPWFPDVLKQELEWDRARDPEKYAHVWLGQYSMNSEARVFRNWKVEEFETPSDAVFRFGADWGFATDPSVLIRCWLKGRTLYVDSEAWAVGCEIDHTPALFDNVEGARKWTITADSSRPETVSYMRRAGFKIVSAIKGPGSLEDGIEFLKSFDIIVHPRCTHVADELTHYAYKKDPLTDEILPVLEDKNNHTIDALRYALEALRRVAPKVVKPSSPNPPDLWSRERRSPDWKTV